MRKISVANCNKIVKNRFELVVIAAFRAKMIAEGNNALSSKGLKPVAAALKEIEEGRIDVDSIKDSIFNEMLNPSNSGSATGAERFVKNKKNIDTEKTSAKGLFSSHDIEIDD